MGGRREEEDGGQAGGSYKEKRVESNDVWLLGLRSQNAMGNTDHNSDQGKCHPRRLLSLPGWDFDGISTSEVALTSGSLNHWHWRWHFHQPRPSWQSVASKAKPIHPNNDDTWGKSDGLTMSLPRVGCPGAAMASLEVCNDSSPTSHISSDVP